MKRNGWLGLLISLPAATALALPVPAVRAEVEPIKKGSVTYLQTPAGVRFGLTGKKATAPAPTLFVFAVDIQTALESKDFNKVGDLLGKHGFLAVALDVPGHGKDVRPGEPGNALSAWRVRTEKDENWLAAFTSKVRDVLGYLILEGYTDPNRVAVAGTSRGGFIATHVAAADPRFRAVVAFAPVTEPMVLTEFHGTARAGAVKALNLVHLADKLAGRSLWLCIGNNDARVGTDKAIAFTRKVVAASLAAKKPLDVFLVVTPTPGHSIHKTAHDEAAAWLLERFKDAK